MSTAEILVVADRDYVGDDRRWLTILGDVARAAEGLPVLIQVRAHEASSDEFATLAVRAREAVRSSVPLFLNGDAALAWRLGYDGVHWPERAIPSSPAGSGGLRRSASVHSVEAVRKAEGAGADMLVFGPVYQPGSKAGLGVGLEAVHEVVAVATVPVFAIGGITPGNAGDCVRAGATGVAVLSGVLAAAEPGAALRQYLIALGAQEVPT